MGLRWGCDVIKSRRMLGVAIEPNRASNIEYACNCLAPTAEYSAVSGQFMGGDERAIAVAVEVEDRWV